MKRKTDLKFYIFLTLLFVLQYLVVTRLGQYVYGSSIDWDYQHYKIPAYFRTQFYATGDLFPDFAANLGAGQNIYNFSYYGLHNPVILISYLLPFVPMKLYLQLSSVLLVYGACVLFYRWLQHHTCRRTALIAAVLFATAASLIFHTHRHSMFVNYMPFLIMAFMGVDRYFAAKKRGLLGISICLCCLTSYFFSIGAIAAVVLYGIYTYRKQRDRITFGSFWKDGLAFLFPVLLGICMAAFLLVPTLITLLGSRPDSADSISVLQLFVPWVHADYLLHDVSSPGLTAIVIYGLFYGVFTCRGADRFLSVSLCATLVFPIFVYLLNGTMYIYPKVLIPLLPLYCLQAAGFLEQAQKKQQFSKKELFLFGAVCLIGIAGQLQKPLIIVDLAATFGALFCFSKFRNFRILAVALALTLCANFLSSALWDTPERKATLAVQSQSDGLIRQALEQDKTFYRITDKTGDLHIANRVVGPDHRLTSVYSSLSNLRYQQFYYDRIGNDVARRSQGQLVNPANRLFDLYMANKYIITDGSQPLGTRAVTTDGSLTLYENIHALPVGYASSRLMSRAQFDTLRYPYDAEALLNYVVVDRDVVCDYETAITPTVLDYTVTEQTGLSVTPIDGGWHISAPEGGSLTAELDMPLENQLVFLEFSLKGTNDEAVGDNEITLNGIKNVLPHDSWRYFNGNRVFQYTLNSQITRSFSLTFSPGEYTITDINTYTADYDRFVSRLGQVHAMEFDTTEPIGDVLCGTVTAEADGYFHISIPYDGGFTLFVDGKETAYEVTDTAFIGFPLTVGTHEIRLEFTAPAAGISRIISLCAWVGFAGMLLLQGLHSRRKGTKQCLAASAK